MNVIYKEGVWVPPGLSLSDYAQLERMIEIARRTAPAMVDDCICITAIGRHADPAKFSYHATGRAIDIRTGLSGHSRETLRLAARPGAILSPTADTESAYDACRKWRRQISNFAGSGYDVVYGIDRNHVDHIHLERDRRDG